MGLDKGEILCYNGILMRLSILFLCFLFFACSQETDSTDSVVYHVEGPNCRYIAIWKIDVDFYLDEEQYGNWSEMVELNDFPFLSIRSICPRIMTAWIHMQDGDIKFYINPFGRTNSETK